MARRGCTMIAYIVSIIIIATIGQSGAESHSNIIHATIDTSSPLVGTSALLPKTRRLIEATVESSSQLTSAGTQAGCDRYRHGYLGLSMCVNYYDDQNKGNQVVLVIGSMTNEGQVDVCNLTISISSLDTAIVKNPAWLPAYPKSTSFKAGTYFPFSATIPVNTNIEAGYTYPPVDIYRGFYACDSNLQPLPEDKVVPAPGTATPPQYTDDEGGGPGTNPSPTPDPSKRFGSRIQWSGLLKSAGGQGSCLTNCLEKLNQETDDCNGASYVLNSGCASGCPATVANWMRDSCTNAQCSHQQCGTKPPSKTTSPAARLHHGVTAFSIILLTSVYSAAAMMWLCL